MNLRNKEIVRSSFENKNKKSDIDRILENFFDRISRAIDNSGKEQMMKFKIVKTIRDNLDIALEIITMLKEVNLLW